MDWRNYKPQPMTKGSYITLFIFSWLVVLVIGFFLLPKFFLESGTLFSFLSSYKYYQIGALNCFAIMIIFTLIMYILDSKLEGLVSILNEKKKKMEYLYDTDPDKDKALSDYLISRISVHSIFAGAMATVLVLILGFFTTTIRPDIGEYVELIGSISSLFILIGIVLVLLSVEIYDTLIGKKWNYKESGMLRSRALRYYVISWYSLAYPVLLLTSLAAPYITFVGCVVFVLIVPRYYFFRNLPFWPF